MSKPIQIKGASDVLRTRLEQSAEMNFRSLNQEALARLEKSFEAEDAAMLFKVQKWIDESDAAPVKKNTLAQLRRIEQRVLKGK